MAMELELAMVKCLPQSCEELAAEDAAEHLDREEEGAARRDPTQVIWSKATCSDRAVNMRIPPPVPHTYRRHVWDHSREAQTASAYGFQRGRATAGAYLDPTFALVVIEHFQSNASLKFKNNVPSLLLNRINQTKHVTSRVPINYPPLAILKQSQ
jgi:hypothetical protein